MVKDIGQHLCEGLCEAPGCSRWAVSSDGNVSAAMYYAFESLGPCSQLNNCVMQL